MRRLALLSVFCVFFSTESQAELVADGEWQFDLPAVAGLCPLSRTVQHDQLYLAQQERLQAGNNRLLAAAVLCDELEAWRRRQVPASSWALWLLAARDGVPVQMPTGLERAKVLDELARAMPKLDLSRVAAEMRQRTAKEGVSLSPQSFGVIDRDRNGLYMAMVGDFTVGDRTTQTYGVVGMTLIGTRIVSLNLYRANPDANSIEDMLPIVQRTLAQAVSLDEERARSVAGSSPSSPPAPARPSVDNERWGTVAMNGLGALLVVGLIVAVGLGWRAWARRQRFTWRR